MTFFNPTTRGASLTRAVLLAFVALPLLLPAHAWAQFPGRTEQGQISVAHLADLISRASSDATARERLSFYLTSVGEATGFLLMHAERAGLAVPCRGPLNVGNDTAWAAISKHAPDNATWSSTPATPILVEDILARAGC